MDIGVDRGTFLRRREKTLDYFRNYIYFNFTLDLEGWTYLNP